MALDDATGVTGSLAILGAIIELLHELGLQVVAEEVENVQQRIILADRGCNMIQDYWISKPLSPEQFLAWLVGQTRNR